MGGDDVDPDAIEIYKNQVGSVKAKIETIDPNKGSMGFWGEIADVSEKILLNPGNERIAEVLKLTAQDLLKMDLIDAMISEPLGGAHRDPEAMAKELKEVILKNLKELKELKKDELLKLRYQKFRKMGQTG